MSEFNDYVKLTKRRQHALQAARKRQGECPTDRRSRQQLFEMFMMQYMVKQMRSLDTREVSHVHSSFIPSLYQPSITPLKDLKELFIKDLRLETHHRGNYILLRSITPLDRMTAIMAIMENEKEEAIML